MCTRTFFARKPAYGVRIQLVRPKRLFHTSTSLRIKRLFLQRLGDSSKWQWQSCWMLSDLSDVAMTGMMDAILFVWRCDDRRDCVTVLIGRPGGSVQRMWSSGIFFPKIWRSDWTVFVIRSSGIRRDLLTAYFCYWASNSYLGLSTWWWAILHLVE